MAFRGSAAPSAASADLVAYNKTVVGCPAGFESESGQEVADVCQAEQSQWYPNDAVEDAEDTPSGRYRSNVSVSCQNERKNNDLINEHCKCVSYYSRVVLTLEWGCKGRGFDPRHGTNDVVVAAVAI